MPLKLDEIIEHVAFCSLTVHCGFGSKYCAGCGASILNDYRFANLSKIQILKYIMPKSDLRSKTSIT